MSRRQFLGSAVGAGVVTAVGARQASGQESPVKTEFYELRQYRLRIGAQPRRLADYLREAAVPALNRLGHTPIGVFDLATGETPTTFVLIPHATLDGVRTLAARLAADEQHRQAGAPFLEAPAVDPPYAELKSELLVAFDSMPKIEVPAGVAARSPRIFELRTYQSHSEAASAKKMEMFTPKLGELDIFRRVGLNPVFFGRAIASWRMPSFTYMLTFVDEAARVKAWGTFGADPAWNKLKAMPGYSDAEILASITSVILRPAESSQI
jgi:NIPSNAP